MEPDVIYECKRHVFELVEEFSDMVWWVSFLCCFFVPLSILFDYPRLALVAWLGAYPTGRFIYEIISWKHETYQIVEAPKDILLIKEWGIISRRKISESVKSISVQTFRLIPFLDWETVHIRSSTHLFVEGRRVPVRLAQEIQKAKTGMGMAERKPTGNPMVDIFAFMPQLVQSGLVDPMVAKGYIEGTLTQMIGAE